MIWPIECCCVAIDLWNEISHIYGGPYGTYKGLGSKI